MLFKALLASGLATVASTITANQTVTDLALQLD